MPPKKREPSSAAGRQDGDYQPPILTQPKGGPIPKRQVSRADESWRLHKYWTQGPGLARWVNSPHPFKTLLAFLMRHMPEGLARKTTHEWFTEVKGFAPTGHPPGQRPEPGDGIDIPDSPVEWKPRPRKAVAANKRKRGARRSADPDPDEVARTNELKEYWLRGEGLARWTRWTQLYNHLRKHLGDERAKRTAAEWFHERYGYWPGADKNRVVNGKPPRGNRIGPG